MPSLIAFIITMFSFQGTLVEIKSTTCTFDASIKCSSVALFLLFRSNPLRWALNGAWVLETQWNNNQLSLIIASVNLFLVEISGIEPLTSCLQGRRSPSWAKPPYLLLFDWKWWAKMDSNHRPHDYQSCALASWAIGPYRLLTSQVHCAVPSKLNNASSNKHLVLTLGHYR